LGAPDASVILLSTASALPIVMFSLGHLLTVLVTTVRKIKSAPVRSRWDDALAVMSSFDSAFHAIMPPDILQQISAIHDQMWEGRISFIVSVCAYPRADLVIAGVTADPPGDDDALEHLLDRFIFLLQSLPGYLSLKADPRRMDVRELSNLSDVLEKELVSTLPWVECAIQCACILEEIVDVFEDDSVAFAHAVSSSDGESASIASVPNKTGFSPRILLILELWRANPSVAAFLLAAGKTPLLRPMFRNYLARRNAEFMEIENALRMLRPPEHVLQRFADPLSREKCLHAWRGSSATTSVYPIPSEIAGLLLPLLTDWRPAAPPLPIMILGPSDAPY
jgi:hypothetical protein